MTGNGGNRGSAVDVNAFLRDGFVRIDGAFAPETAAQARSLLWQVSGCVADDPASWTRPVVRLGHFSEGPFRQAMRTPVLDQACDALVGEGRWRPLDAIGTFVIRFPSGAEPDDDGWHVDMSFDYDKPDFLDWRINLASRGRALLMLFLFSDVGPDDAPTRIRAGSHKDVARQLAPAGDAGLTLRELARDGFAGSADRPEVLATGPAGTVYLCHPFLVHAAQKHRGTQPRFLAQPPLLPTGEFRLDRAPENESAVERAIREAIAADHLPKKEGPAGRMRRTGPFHRVPRAP